MSYDQDELNQLNGMFNSSAWELFRDKTIDPLLKQSVEHLYFKPGVAQNKGEYVFWSSVYYIMNLLSKTPANILDQVKEHEKQFTQDSDYIDW